MYEYKKRIPSLFTGMRRKKRKTAKIAWKSCDEELDSSFLATLFFSLLVWCYVIWYAICMIFIRLDLVKAKSKMPFRWCSGAAQSNAFISSTTHTQPSSNFFYFYRKNDKTLTIGWILWLLFYILAHINVEKYRIILDTHWMCSVYTLHMQAATETK